MPIEGPIPGWLFFGVAVATVFTVMVDLGLAIVPGDFRRAWQHPGLMLKGLFSVLVVVAAVALAVTRAFDLALLALVNVWQTVVDAGLHATAAIALTTALVLACGHLLGGPDPASRTALAIVSAARNPALALLVAVVNGAAPAIIATVLAYLVVSALTVIPYLIWRHRVAALPRQR